MADEERIVNIQSAEEVVTEQDEKRELELESEDEMEQPLTELVRFFRTAWEDAKRSKIEIEREMLESLRQRKGEYSPWKLSEIREVPGSEIYVKATANKCFTAESWIQEIVGNRKMWTFVPSPDSEIDPTMLAEIQQTALQGVIQDVNAFVAVTGDTLTESDIRDFFQRKAQELRDNVAIQVRKRAMESAERIDSKVDDVLTEGNFTESFFETVKDVITYKFGCLKGPFFRTKKKKKWIQNEAGVSEIEVIDDLVMQFERVNPFDLFFEPGMRKVDEGYVIERHQMSPKELEGLRFVPGFNTVKIEKVIDLYRNGGLREWLAIDSEKEDLETESSIQLSLDTNYIDVLEFWGNVQGKMLIEWGFDEELIEDEFEEIEINMWMVGNDIIKVVTNPDPMGRKPYKVTSYDKVPGSLFGLGVPEKMDDIQDAINSVARALTNNVAMASGPQIELDIDRIQDDGDLDIISPWKVYRKKNDLTLGNVTDKAIDFHTPQSVAGELIQIMREYLRMADDNTGIPAFAHGDPSVGGAGNTATGLSMLMSAAARGIKAVINNLDTDIIGPSVGEVFDFLVLSGEVEYRGDVTIVSKGINSVAAAELNLVRSNEFLATVSSNELFVQLVGIEGLGMLLEQSAKALNLDMEHIISKNVKQIMAVQAQQALAAQQRPPGENPKEMDMSGQNAAGGTDVNATGNGGN